MFHQLNFLPPTCALISKAYSLGYIFRTKGVYQWDFNMNFVDWGDGESLESKSLTAGEIWGVEGGKWLVPVKCTQVNENWKNKRKPGAHS